MHQQVLRALHIAEQGKSETFYREFATWEIPVKKKKGGEKKTSMKVVKS